ncbi:MAG: GNAT family N-acetyltransferase [Pseudomonadota bacterium]
MSTPEGYEIRLSDPRAADLAPLFAAHVAHGAAHYPSESNHELSADDLFGTSAAFFVAREVETGEPVGMAALVALSSDAAELKSMHVLPVARGSGLASALMQAVLFEAQCQSFENIWLETGSRDASAAARRLYARYGFELCPPFGAYVEDPESVFMTLALTRSSQSATPPIATP